MPICLKNVPKQKPVSELDGPSDACDRSEDPMKTADASAMDANNGRQWIWVKAYESKGGFPSMEKPPVRWMEKMAMKSG